MDQNKHFFISYKSLELDFAIRLATDLKNAGFCIWMDTQERNISTSDDWRLAIETAITPQNCTALVAVLSPAYISSTYCRNELARADRLGIPIIPVFIHAIDEEDWPLEIERLQHISFIGNINGEGYDSQLIKLIDLLKDNYPEHLIAIPDKETQYINSLIGSLESQFGVSNFIEPRMYIEVYEFRPKPTVDDEWGYSLLIPDINSDSIVESTPIQSIDEAIRKTNKFVLLGEPGAGKTTTLRRIALNAAKLHLSDPQHTPIPLLLNLPQWARNQTFEEFIVQKWTLSENPIELIDSGRLCLFLDGLNEMGEEGPKRGNEISGWIANRSADSIIVLTCRIADFSNGLKIDNIPTVEIHELNDEQIKAFVSKYLEDNDIEYFQNQIFPDDAEDAPTPSPYALVHLARNPYLLTALLFIYLSSENKILPQNTGALFQQLVRSLWRREELRGTISLDFKNIEASLSRLAFSMIDSGMPVDVSEGYALFYVVDTEIIRHGINSNLLIQDDGSIRFYHQLVQEYFAALGLSQVGLDHIKLLDSNQSYKDSPFSFIFQLEHVETNKWDQVIIALCGIETEPERIIKIVAIIDPGLGIRCINSGVKINLADVYDSFFRAANIDDEKIRSAGITALGKLGDSRAIPFLVTNIFNPDEYVQ
ncbi:TIR domain-containing protein, partial [bacterium]|nr:TIR domain-containing protein [bacterium]